MVKGKGSPALLAQQAGKRMSGSRHQKRAQAAIERKAKASRIKGIKK